MTDLNGAFYNSTVQLDTIPTEVVDVPVSTINTTAPFTLTPGPLNPAVLTKALSTLLPQNQQIYMLNEKNTLNALYGPPVLPWNTDFKILNDVRQQQGVNAINMNAVFQQKVLHVDYNMNRVPIGLVPIAVAIPVAQVPVGAPVPVPVPVTRPIIVAPVPVPVTQVIKPPVAIPITQPIRTTIVAPVAIPVAGVVKPPIVAQVVKPPIVVPVIQVAKPIIASPTIAKPPISPAKPLVVIHVAQVAKPIIASPTITKPPISPVRPLIAIPVTQVAKPSIIPVIPQVARPPVAVTQVAKPSIIPVIPQVARPPVARPSIVTVVAPTRTPKPLSPNGIVAGVSNGITSVRDVPNFVVSNIFARQITTQQPITTVPTVRMPTFNTIVTPVQAPVRRPDITPALKAAQLPNQKGRETIASVLAEINPELLVATRVGKNKQGYSRNQLIEFARRLGISVSGDKKQKIKDEILKLFREMGL